MPPQRSITSRITCWLAALHLANPQGQRQKSFHLLCADSIGPLRAIQRAGDIWSHQLVNKWEGKSGHMQHTEAREINTKKKKKSVPTPSSSVCAGLLRYGLCEAWITIKEQSTKAHLFMWLQLHKREAIVSSSPCYTKTIKKICGCSTTKLSI